MINWITTTDESRIEQHHRNLAIFFDTVQRYGIKTMYDNKLKGNNYPLIKDNFDCAGFLFEEFCKELPKEIDKPENGNGRALEIRIKDLFFPMIDEYCKWYKTNEEELKKFEPHNFYKSFFNNAVRTKKEIEKYYPLQQVQTPQVKADDELNHVQKALLYYYSGQSLPENSEQRLINNYNKFSKPGEAGRTQRRRSGERKRSLSTRLGDFEKIKIMLTEKDRQKLSEDEKAVLNEIQSL